MLGIVVWVMESTGANPFDVVSHVPVKDRNKLEERLRAGWEFQAATCVWVRGTLKAKPPGNTQMDLRK